ncbi:HNH endonuclease signature motif containing protein [Macrococcoides caseolyticum]|uniref:HNH endonuclease signature motif containing protein n=1 Tax=Macrococcoides caseolyticum TaxID=69966 RepID=UPI001F3BAA32|nr:HNH endonuclease signature motif containing protein [Macrococcus caseolyticus]MCE4957725.1 HNH endonuclease [Macrococcus caseolyticus]
MTEHNFTSRNIPLPIQREVRRRCGFGCVICGNPIYDYDHMKGWAEVREHVAEDITLLCPKHHREATAKRLPREIVLEANENPYNLKNGKSTSHELFYLGNKCEFLLGGDSYSYTFECEGSVFIPLMIDGSPVIKFRYENNHLLLSMVLLDKFNIPILLIIDNQLTYSVDVWDIQFVGNKLTLREAHRKILFEIEFYPPNKVSIVKGNILFNGVKIDINPGIVITGNTHISINGVFEQNKIGYNIGHNPYNIGAGRNLIHVDRNYN